LAAEQEAFIHVLISLAILLRSFDKLEIIFAPLFFAIIGAQVNLTGFNLGVLFLSAIVIAIAVVPN
jgi:Kef-type K+ transport system membrane component KefB